MQESKFPGNFLNISEGFNKNLLIKKIYFLGLTDAMDIFSMGCVILELLSDCRQVAFTLPQAIDYNKMDERAAKIYLRKIMTNIPEEFRELLSIMLERDHVKRREDFYNVTIGQSK